MVIKMILGILFKGKIGFAISSITKNIIQFRIF